MTRRPDTGLVRPYRPCPSDFRDTFLRFGWSKELREHYRTNDRCLARWLEEAGGDALRAERAAITGSVLRPTRRSYKARDYVLGIRLRGMRAPTFFDAMLMEEVR